MARKFPKGFDEWVQCSPLQGQENNIAFSTFANERNRNGGDVNAFPAVFFQAVKNNERAVSQIITINDAANQTDFTFPYNEVLPSIPKDDETDDAHILTVNSTNPNVSIKGAAIRTLNIHSNAGQFDIENCYIGFLQIQSGTTQRMVNIKNCWIGRLELTSASVDSLSVGGGGIAFIKTPPPDRENPITGTASFVDVLLPTNRKQTQLFTGTQPYRNLRSHMEKLNNGPMANMFRTLELKSERKESDKKLTWLLNGLYDITSGYGSSPGKPLIWLIALYLACTAMALCYDTGVTPLADDQYVGWRANLNNENTGHIWRAFFLPLQSMISPAGLLSTRNLVVAQTALGGTIFSIFGLFMDALVFLSILAIRKRFKLT